MLHLGGDILFEGKEGDFWMEDARRILLNKYDGLVPRYTSYPPATQFAALDPAQAPVYPQWLASVEGAVSLYVHIPFCARLCYYCGCTMRVVNEYQPVTDYLSLLKNEIESVSRQLPSGCSVTHLHFGGGSPTILKPDDFLVLMELLKDHFPFSSDAEIGIEADPRHLTQSRIKAYAAGGVTRLSMGVQDFNDEVLEAINRPQPYALTRKAIGFCRAHGITDINFDLMYGLPYQTSDRIKRTMDLAVALRPQRIAYFGYAHVPWMKQHMTLLPQAALPNPEDRYTLQHLGAKCLEEAGYAPVGIDHFVLPEDSMKAALDNGTLHRNFQGYTTDCAATLIGLGASSIGEFSQGYIQNVPDLRAYKEKISSENHACGKTLFLQENDRPVKAVIESLMCFLSVDLEDICKKYACPPSFFDESITRLRGLQDDGILSIKGQKITIDPSYRVLARVVCEAFDSYAQAAKAKGTITQKRHASAV